MWFQLLSEGGSLRKPLVLVTSDTKEDWRNQVQGGRPVGPRRELVQEYSAATGCQLFLLEPADLLEISDALGVAPNRASVQDIERVKNEPTETTRWSHDGLLAVLGELERQEHVQVDVIREAAHNGGRIGRERVYELDGRSDSQMLRGFTRHVTRVTMELQNRGIVPSGVPPLLRAVYEAGVKSSHFVIPAEVVEHLTDALPTADVNG